VKEISTTQVHGSKFSFQLTKYGLGEVPVSGQHFQFVWYKLIYPSASTIPNWKKIY